NLGAPAGREIADRYGRPRGRPFGRAGKRPEPQRVGEVRHVRSSQSAGQQRAGRAAGAGAAEQASQAAEDAAEPAADAAAEARRRPGERPEQRRERVVLLLRVGDRRLGAFHRRERRGERRQLILIRPEQILELLAVERAELLLRVLLLLGAAGDRRLREVEPLPGLKLREILQGAAGAEQARER